MKYNEDHGITPKQIRKNIDESLTKNQLTSYQYDESNAKAAEKELPYLSSKEIEDRIKDKRKEMEKAAKALDFLVAAKLRDEIKTLQGHL